MSNMHLRLAWLQKCGGPTAKAVLVSMADHADEDGACFPSVARLAAHTELSERAVRSALRRLEAAGLVKSRARSGTSTLYVLNLETPAPSAAPASRSAPAVGAGGQDVPPTPAPDAAPPRQDVPDTPAPAAPKPSLNHQMNHHLTTNKGADEPAPSDVGVETQAAKRGPGVRELVAEGVDRQHAEDWLKIRRAKKAPLTETALDIVKREAAKAGITLAEAIAHAASSNWAGFKAKWLDEPGSIGRSNRQTPTSGRFGGFEHRDYGTGGRL